MARTTEARPNNNSARGGLTVAWVTLGLAVVFVAAVLIGAKVLVDRHIYAPVAMGTVDAPGSSSPQCDSIVGDLPGKVGDYRKVDVAAPAPQGTGAYRNHDRDELTVRCGVSTPSQYTDLSDTEERGGTTWLRVRDTTKGSDLSTWYAVGQSPVVAVTASGDLDGADLDDLGGLISSHGDTAAAPEPQPAPLTDLRAAPGADAAACDAFTAALPGRIGDASRVTDRAGLPAGTVAYTAPGLEPVVVRCGVAAPSSYHPGVQLQQVDEVPWFAESSLDQGSTEGRYFAVGYSPLVALSMPADAGNDAITQISRAVAGALHRTGN
ncbi:DUF3515 domain-containing protein [Corynebacterium bovis]|uniref:DUF3515 domain-containing protein n=1 Tax=Corynebacterium bovis TaxID=36808 RepID=UPI0031397CA8